jgi:hypothetical protein
MVNPQTVGSRKARLLDHRRQVFPSANPVGTNLDVPHSDSVSPSLVRSTSERGRQVYRVVQLALVQTLRLALVMIGCSPCARASRHNRSSEYEIPNARRYAEVARHRVTMMAKMSQSMAAQARCLGKLPTMHGIVNQEIRNVSEDHAARCSAGQVTIHMLDWDWEPGAKDEAGRPTAQALPDFLVLVSPEPSLAYRAELETFDRSEIRRLLVKPPG